MGEQVETTFKLGDKKTDYSNQIKELLSAIEAEAKIPVKRIVLTEQLTSPLENVKRYDLDKVDMKDIPLDKIKDMDIVYDDSKKYCIGISISLRSHESLKYDMIDIRASWGVFFSSRHSDYSDDDKRLVYQNCIELAKTVYKVFHPSIGWTFYAHSHAKANYFYGPALVKEKGREKLLKAPVYKVEELPDGGILIQTQSKVDDYPDEEPIDEYLGSLQGEV